MSNNKMTFIGKILSDRDQFGGSMNLAKTVENCKCSKAQKAEFVVFQSDIKSMLPLAFSIFRDRFNAVHNADFVDNMNEFADDPDKRNALFSAISAVIDDIGIIGAGKLAGASMIYAHAVEISYRYFDEYHGKALTVKSQLTNAKKMLREYLDAPNGVNTEAISNTQKTIERLETELAMLKTRAGNVTLEWRQSGDGAFITNMEKFLCKMARNQEPMSDEEFKAYKKTLKTATNNKKAAKTANK